MNCLPFGLDVLFQQEKEVAIVQKEQCFEELQSRLEDSAAALEVS